ncbi:MAG: hypothetical protein ACRCS9_10960 [Hyphomicrobium sp.]
MRHSQSTKRQYAEQIICDPSLKPLLYDEDDSPYVPMNAEQFELACAWAKTELECRRQDREATQGRSTEFETLNFGANFVRRFQDVTGEAPTLDLLVAYGLTDSDWDRRLEQIRDELWGDPETEGIARSVVDQLNGGDEISKRVAYFRVAERLRLRGSNIGSVVKKIEKVFLAHVRGPTGNTRAPFKHHGVLGSMRIRLAKQRFIVDPETNLPLTPDATHVVPNSHFWRRLLLIGDVEKID